MTKFLNNGLFGNPITRRKKELLTFSKEDHIFLDEILKKTLSKVTDSHKERLGELEDNLNEITEWNMELDDENHVDFIDISYDLEKLNAVKKHLSIMELGGVTKYKKEELKKALKNSMAHPANFDWEAEYMSYYPEDYNRKLPRDGAWVMIIKDVPVKFSPEKYTIFYAKPVAKDRNIYGGKYKSWKAKIIANDQELYLWPHEYVVIHDANLLLEEIGETVEMVTLSGTGRLDKNKVFYLKSRGFSQVEVYQILFKSLTSQSFAYFKLLPHAEYYFELLQEGYTPSIAEGMVRKSQEIVPEFNFKFK